MSITTNDTVFLKRDGQAQSQRMPRILNPQHVPLDNRSVKDFLEYVYKISKEVKYFNHATAGEDTSEGTWQDIFSYNCSNFDELFSKLEGLKKTRSLPAHFSLLFTFLELYKEPQRLMNTITGRHLDYYYTEVLGLKKNDPVADKAHVIFELKKNTAPVLLSEGVKLSAGKDNLKKDLFYSLTHDIIVNTGKVEQLKSLYIDPANGNYIHYAPVANSSDGLGAELDAANPKWNAFGYEELPLAQVGFCLASDVLRMQEGDRTVSVVLQLEGLSSSITDGQQLVGLFLVTLTGANGWTESKTVTPTVEKTNDNTGKLKFTFSLTADDPAIIIYDAGLHGTGYGTNKPVLKILLDPSAAMGYTQFKDADLLTGKIDVTVTGMTTLDAENDFGALNAKKPFHPFGTSPENGANFWVGSSEVFTKDLESLQLNIEWKNVPQNNLGNYYKGYNTDINNEDLTVNATFSDAAGWNIVNETHRLFRDNATAKDENNFSIIMKMGNKPKTPGIKRLSIPADILPLQITRSPGRTLQQEVSTKSMSLMPTGFSLVQQDPGWFTAIRGFGIRRIDTSNSVNSMLRKGFLHLSLNQGFLFREYRELFTKLILQISKPEGGKTTADLIKEPFAPEAQRITLDYKATTGQVSFRDNTLDDYANTEIELYHAGAFGQMREHSYARNQTPFLAGKFVKLLPSYTAEGNFYIGISGVRANDSVCILFQVADGSADPDLDKVDLSWKVLCDNYWKELSTTDLIFETTNDLLTSGVIKLVIPREATSVNTIMPDGLTWFGVSIEKNSKAVCNLIDVKANAAIAEFENNDNDPEHFKAPLPASTISKLQQPNGSIKSVTQPYASFGGQMQENSNGFYTRVSERLRHKQRAISIWDYERLILQQFPGIFKVKAINHASTVSFTDAGHTLMVVIPDLTNQNAVNPFQPKADKNTLDEIFRFLQAHSTAWAEHHVVNPFYEPVKVSVSVKLKTGYEFNYYQAEIDKVLKSYLSPWINGSATDIHFGGKITESAIVKLLEDLEYVDYITGLKLFQSTDGGLNFQLKKQVIETTNPATILVSHTQHEVNHS